MVEKREMHTQPAGEPKLIRQAILETGSSLLQDFAPVKQFDIYVAGFHPSRDDPSMQMEAHHYCRQVNQDFLQCVLFDGNTGDANLIGIEYIISEKLFDGLPPEERKYWHPHNFEILSGQLVAPGLPDVAEKAMLRLLMNSYGKTWHTWHTGRYDRPGSGDALPMGDPMLMWSFNRDGEADEAMLLDRNRRMEIDVERKRRERQDLVRHAHPQHGVDLLKGSFPGAAAAPPPGVRDRAEPRDDPAV
ncbi:MAG TPA: OBAP family protein [Longimicrobiaceae bacterium]|nr:OBAP family protein [Longimicrobiaceae bacterium]